jgi:tetratricopeptide (TPR) repeat protein
MLVPHIDSCLESCQSASAILRYSDDKFSLAFAENGRLRDSMELREKILDAKQRTLGSERPDTLLSMNDLAASYSNLERHWEAMELKEKTFEARRRTLGDEHPDTLSAMNNLAASYTDLGRHQEAMKL